MTARAMTFASIDDARRYLSQRMPGAFRLVRCPRETWCWDGRGFTSARRDEWQVECLVDQQTFTGETLAEVVAKALRDLPSHTATR